MNAKINIMSSNCFSEHSMYDWITAVLLISKLSCTSPYQLVVVCCKVQTNHHAEFPDGKKYSKWKPHWATFTCVFPMQIMLINRYLPCLLVTPSLSMRLHPLTWKYACEKILHYGTLESKVRFRFLKLIRDIAQHTADFMLFSVAYLQVYSRLLF